MSNTKELAKSFEPAGIEERWYPVWEQRGYFDAGLDPSKPSFSIQLPPPNITGILHMGHAFNQTVMDSLTRYYRMSGYNTMWLPGTDHAGIATQIVVERLLQKEGKDKRDIGRDAFVERIWEWQKFSGGTILNQMRRLGDSLDWKRLYFTMNDKLSAVVRETFVQLYNEGLIYKGLRLVNWDPKLQSAVSDLEVESEEENGHMWEIRYPAVDGSEGVVVATTRPETLFGDQAVAVHPDDERYKHLVGKMLKLPLTDREIPVIADEYVDKDFGSGCVKITPAHDFNDFEVGKRHNLEMLSVLDKTAHMNENCPAKYRGMDRYECRKAAVEDLKALGLLVNIKAHKHMVPRVSRTGEIVEPMLSEQWYMAMSKPAGEGTRYPGKSIAEVGLEAVESGEVNIFPKEWQGVYRQWLENIQDWCISRQLWWGHRIPAWTCPQCGKLIVSEEDPTSCPDCGSTELVQESDVLDTWFSSALWPFSTMGWPDKTKDLATFYPTSVLVTGFDILFFWVARMMMMGLHFMDQVPFKHVYLHALVRDAQGRKMSKSTGNVIDPLVMIEKYGTDALRFTLTAFAAMGRDIRLSEDRIEGYRHFVNKLWNASRFALMNLPEDVPAAVELDKVQGLHHQWLLHRLEEVKKDVDGAIEAYRFNDAAQTLYKFLWNEFCDWYLELIKPDMKEEGPRKTEAQYVLWTALREFLILMHPIMPFVTAEIWQALPGGAGSDAAVQLLPEARPGCLKPEAAARMEFVQEVIGMIRTIRAELNIAPSYRLTVLLRPSDAHQKDVLEANREVILTLARLGELIIDADGEAPKASASHVAQGCEVIVHLSGAVDFAAELARLEKELGKIDKELGGLNQKLANEGFVSRAPAEIVERERARVAELTDARVKLTALQQRFRDVM